MAVESCGFPFPSEVIMPLGGALAAGAFADAAAHPSLGAVIVAGAAGNLVGSIAAYALAARFGEPLLLGPGRWVGISRAHVELADRWFQRHGLLAVFVGRLLPAVRTYISFPAGLARVEPIRFALLTFLGALPWSAGLAVAGYEIGANYDRVSGPIQKAAIGIGAVVVVVVVGWIVRGRRAAAHGTEA